MLANLPGVEVPSDSSSVSPQEDNSENETMRYKQEIECCLRSEGYAGFLIPSLPGRTMAEEWLEFCSPVVSLAEFPKFVYSNTDTLEIHVDAYNAMYAPVSDIKNTYYITDDSMKVVSGGVLSQGDLPVGRNIYIGKVRFPLNGIKTPSRLTLNVLIGGKLKNHWDFQVYPSDAESEEEPKTDTQ